MDMEKPSGKPGEPGEPGKQEPKPLTLSHEEIQRIHRLVAQYLPPDYDREFVADTIILHAWMKDVPHVSREYIRNKCISAWRTMKRERRRNKEVTILGTRATAHEQTEQPLEEDPGGQVHAERKMLVEEAVGKLNNLERRLIWMRFYDSQTLDEIAEKTSLRREQVQASLKVAIYKMRVHLT